MNGPRKPPAKIEGRKRMQVSGLTVTWQGTRSLKDWMAYLENGSGQGRLVLADQVSERAVKSLLARIQSLSRAEVEALGRPVEPVAAAQGGGPPVRPPRGGGGQEPPSGSEVVLQVTSGRQLALAGDTGGQGSGTAGSRRRRLSTGVGGGPTADNRRPARASARDLAGTVRQLRSRVESLEDEQEQLRTELALLRGEVEPYDGPPSIFVTGWFRATLVLIVLAIVVVVTVPWLMDLLDGGTGELSPSVRTEAPAPAPGIR
jgi:hypothetical protein